MLQVTTIVAFMSSPVGVLRDPQSVAFSILKLTRINAAVLHGDFLNEASAGVLFWHGPVPSVVKWPDQVTRDRGRWQGRSESRSVGGCLDRHVCVRDFVIFLL